MIIKDMFDELLLQGIQLLHRGKAWEAAEKLEQAHLLDPDHEDASLNLSGAYILMGKFKLAVPLLENLVEENRGSASVYTNLGAAYLGNPILARDEEQLKAIGAFKQALKYNPVAPSVAYNIGLIYRDRGDFNEAALWFGKAVTANPKDEDARRLLSRMKIQKENTLHNQSKISNDGSEVV